MSTVQREEQLTLEEFMRLYDEEGPFEFIDGVRKPLMPQKAYHVVIVRALSIWLYTLCKSAGLGEIFTEAPYVQLHSSHWVKGSLNPDVMFFKMDRWQDYKKSNPDWRDKPFVLVPDLAVEVISPTDNYTDIHIKVRHYLADGVRLIWVVDPNDETIGVYEGDRLTTLRRGDTLTGAEVIPGFSVPVGDVFDAE